MPANWWVFYVPGEEGYWSDSDYIERVRTEWPWWTCHENTRKGDYALLYAIAPVSALVAVFAVESNAQHEENEFTSHAWACNIRCIAIFENPLTFRKMRTDCELGKWNVVRGNFQPPGGRPPQVDIDALRLLTHRIPELARVIGKKPVEAMPETATRATRRATNTKSKQVNRKVRAGTTKPRRTVALPTAERSKSRKHSGNIQKRLRRTRTTKDNRKEEEMSRSSQLDHLLHLTDDDFQRKHKEILTALSGAYFSALFKISRDAESANMRSEARKSLHEKMHGERESASSPPVAQRTAKPSLGNQIPSQFGNLRHVRKVREGGKWVLTTKRGVRVAVFDSEAELDDCWKAFQQAQKQMLPQSPIQRRQRRRDQPISTASGSPMGKVPNDPKKPWSEEYDLE